MRDEEAFWSRPINRGRKIVELAERAEDAVGDVQKEHALFKEVLELIVEPGNAGLRSSPKALALAVLRRKKTTPGDVCLLCARPRGGRSYFVRIQRRSRFTLGPSSVR